MTTDQLAEGMVLQLEQDVKNPTPDRREKYRWDKLPVWRAGTRFIVRARMLRNPDERWLTIEPLVQYGILASLPLTDPRIEAVLAASVETPPTLATVMADAKDWGYEHVLDVLLNEGKITLDDVRHALTVGV